MFTLVLAKVEVVETVIELIAVDVMDRLVRA